LAEGGMICPANHSSALCLPSPATARSMACKVSAGAMLGRLFCTDSAIHPDTRRDTRSSSSTWHDLIRDLSKSLSTTSSVQSQQARSCLQATIAAFEASTGTAAEQAEILRSLLAADLPATMLMALPNLDFEARKEVMRLFHAILQAGASPVFDYVRNHAQVMQLLLDGCRNEELALPCHMMLRSCALNSELVVCMLEAGFATELLKLAQHQVFDISSDAFASLRALLLTHKSAAAGYLEKCFREFFAAYNELLQTDDYVTKRQALRLLAEILLDRSCKDVMLLYIAEDHFLQVQMNLLRDNSKAIQADAFHVFKIFAAAPNKRLRVHQILFRNRERLVKLLERFDKENDETLLQDRDAVVQALCALEATPAKTIAPHQ